MKDKNENDVTKTNEYFLPKTKTATQIAAKRN